MMEIQLKVTFKLRIQVRLDGLGRSPQPKV